MSHITCADVPTLRPNQKVLNQRRSNVSSETKGPFINEDAPVHRWEGYRRIKSLRYIAFWHPVATVTGPGFIQVENLEQDQAGVRGRSC